MTHVEQERRHQRLTRFALDHLGGNAEFEECKAFLGTLVEGGVPYSQDRLDEVEKELRQKRQSLPTKADRDASHIRRILREEHGMESLRTQLEQLDRVELLRLLGLA